MSGWLEETDPPRFRAQDEEGFVTVGVEGFERADLSFESLSFDTDKYDVVSGETEALLLEPVNVVVLDHEKERLGRHLLRDDPQTFDPPVILRADSHLSVSAIVDTDDGGVRLSEGSDSRIRVDSTGRLRVNLGVELPRERPSISLPKSEYNLCRALSLAFRTTNKEDPTRSSPFVREPAATVQWGEKSEKNVPDQLLRDERPEVVCQVDSLAAAAAVTPLAAYLDAGVAWLPEAGGPLLVAGDQSFSLRLPRSSDDGLTPGTVLQTVFYLDCLARAPEEDEPYGKSSVLTDLGLDAERLLELPMHRRVARYLSLETEPSRILERFPEWHLSVSVDPELDRLRRLVPFAERLPIVHTVDDPDIDHSGADQQRVPLVEPETTPGRTHAWYAEGYPSEGFKLLSSTRRHLGERQTEIGEDDTVLEVVVVSNTENTESRERAEDGYRERAEELPLSVTRREGLSPSELASVFQSDVDLVHFVGSCDAREGLQCPDGEYFDAAKLGSVGASAFMLNASTSYQQGRALIRSGAVGGVVTKGTAVSPRVRPVGVTFARLVAVGWPLVTALRRAEKTHPQCDTHLVLGDGTLRVAGTDGKLTPTVTVESPASRGDPYSVEIVHDQPLSPGATVSWPFDGCERLAGSGEQYEFDREELNELLQELRSPVAVDGDLVWPEELLTELYA